MEKFEYGNYIVGEDKLVVNIDYISEAFDFIRLNRCSKILICEDIDKKYDKTPRLENFDFLYGCDFIEEFDCLALVSKKANIDGLYSLKNLKKLRSFSIQFLNLGKFSKLRRINIIYVSTITGWDKLKDIEYIQLGGIKKVYDFSFLANCKMKELRIIGGSIESLNGLETCTNLNKIMLQGCTKLTSVKSTIEKMAIKPALFIEGCGKVNVETEIKPLNLDWTVVEYGGKIIFKIIPEIRW